MKLRAFVVMPFGSKPITDDHSVVVDFDRVYTELLEPALKEAGCQPFRADSEVSAGDIRTDMFFELVTSDVVVADLTTNNANVYYELGIRDGVSRRGVFIIRGDVCAARPFDIVSDRSFTYPSDLFLTSKSSGYHAIEPSDIPQAQARLSERFKEALDADAQTTGSPLYAHLPGLKPVDWQDIETSKSRYFGALRHNWEEKVRQAQNLHRPGHIITIADDAPTRMHRTRIMAQAARSLIGLCQFHAAVQVLTEILQLTPDDLETKHQLGTVLATLGDVERAKTLMNEILEQQKDVEASLDLGLIYRAKWYLGWTNDPNPRQRASRDARLLAEAIDKFNSAQRRHPEQFLNGYNALLLIAIRQDLFPHAPPSPPFINVDELTTVVRYTAIAARERAELTADTDILFWSAVSLSGLAIIQNDQETAIRLIEEACDVPSVTLFHLQNLHDRIVLLDKLKFRPEIVEQIKTLISDALAAGRPSKSWRKVVVFSGYELGESRAFPLASASNVELKITETLKRWVIGAGDLAICAGVTAGDIMFAQTCLSLGAHVRLLMPDQNAGDLAEPYVDPIAAEWVNKSSALADSLETEVWNHTEEIGAPVEPTDLKSRNNRWILNTAVAETNLNPATRLYGLVLWDEALRVDDPEDPSFFIARIRQVNPLRNVIDHINPVREVKPVLSPT